MSRALVVASAAAAAAAVGYVVVSGAGRGKVQKRLRVRLTRYWPAVLGPGSIPLMSLDHVPLAWVSADSLAALRMEGTGILEDGRRVNYFDGEHWMLVPPGVHGYGAGGRELVYWESIAVDPAVIELDSVCHLVELRRWVRAVDVGSMIKGLHIDLFVPGAGVATGDDARDHCTVEVYG